MVARANMACKTAASMAAETGKSRAQPYDSTRGRAHLETCHLCLND
ncbi:hypothetical protein T12_13458, partial [Trichinella patagoniensis]